MKATMPCPLVPSALATEAQRLAMAKIAKMIPPIFRLVDVLILILAILLLSKNGANDFVRNARVKGLFLRMDRPLSRNAQATADRSQTPTA